MKKIIKFLAIIFSINVFSSCAKEEKNTIGFKYYFDEQNKTCLIAAKKGFNYEEIIIPNEVIKNNVAYRIVGFNSNTNGAVEDINVDFLEGNKFIKKIYFENEYITMFPWDIFRSSSLKYIDMSKATRLTIFGDHVFTDSALEEIILPPNLELTYTGVFSGTKLKSVTFPDSYNEMYIDTFFNCKKLEYVNLGSGIKEISGSCFERTPLLKEVKCPSVTSINSHAFRETPQLECVDLNDVDYIGYMAFYKSGIKEVNLSNVYLEKQCFNESKVKSVSINNCNEIPYKAFGDCDLLETLVLSGVIYSIESSAFKNSKISEITIPNSVTFIGSDAFYNCQKLQNVNLSSYLESISSNAFKKCKSLKQISFPNTLKRIYDGAFVDTGLKDVTLSKNVDLLGTCFPKKCTINYV